MKVSSEASGECTGGRHQLDPENWLTRYGDQLYNFALSRMGHHDQAEEVVQETLLAAVRSMKDFEGRSTEKTWLFAILRNKILDSFRSQWKSKSHLPLEEEADPERSIFTADGDWANDSLLKTHCPLESKELWQIVQLCLRKLPGNQAKVFVLRVLEEKNSEDVCNELQISATKLAARLYRARLSLARCVSERWK